MSVNLSIDSSATLRRKVKASSYIAQYPVLRTIQSALHFTSLTDLFTQTPSRLLWEVSSHMLQLMREGCSYTYPPLSIVRYSFIQLSELELCRVKKLVRGFNTAAPDSNPVSCNRVRSSTPEPLRCMEEESVMSHFIIDILLRNDTPSFYYLS